MHHPNTKGGVVRFTVTVAMALALVLGLATAAYAVHFPDVQPGSEYYDDIECLAAEGIVGGFADGKYHTYMDVERQQFAKMILGAIGGHTESDSWPGDPQNPTFPDATPDDTSLFDYIEEAAYLEIIKGTTSGDFQPAAEIQRYQMALMIVRAAEGALEDVPAGYPTMADQFADHATIAELGAEAEAAVYKLKYNGIVGGFEDGTFRPYSFTNRGQAAKVVCGLMEDYKPAMPQVPEDPAPKDHSSFISNYEGPQTCEACHEGVTEDVSNSLHFSMEEEEVPGFQGMSGRY